MRLSSQNLKKKLISYFKVIFAEAGFFESIADQMDARTGERYDRKESLWDVRCKDVKKP